VAITGAGIAGLTAGLAFAQKGWRVRVYEQHSWLRSLSAGIHLWENGLRVLGVLAPIISDVIPASRRERRNPDGEVFSNSLFGPDFRLYVPLQTRLLTALYDALVETGGEVVSNSRVVAAPDGWLYFANGTASRADLIVGADGIASTVRESLGLLKWRRRVGQFGYSAVIRLKPRTIETEAEGTHCEFWSGSRCLRYAPATADLAYVQLTALAGDRSGSAVPVDRQSWCAQFPSLSSVIGRIPDDGHGEWFEIVRPHYWSNGRVAIVGDAATAQPPSLGYGAGCAMMTAFALAETLDRCNDLLDGLAEWELRERPFTDWVQWVAYRYGQLAFPAEGARTAVLKGVDASRWVKRRILLAPVWRDVTAAKRHLPVVPPDMLVYPLMH
jgi:2-polyprenyl-6-methoxyphenol hydroxylase-like FAD-dependent oxidoreductase